MVSASAVTLDRTDRVLHVVLNNPPANQLGQALIDGLNEAVAALTAGDAKVMVISSGIDGMFAAGADIKRMAELTPETLATYRDALREPIEAIAGCGRPTIAAIDGLALGGGLELAMACTLRFASSAAALGLPEVKLGLIPGAGGTQRLPWLVGRGRALDLLLSGRSAPAVDAAAIGLVDRLSDTDVVADALTFARQLAGYPLSAMQSIIACVGAATGAGFADGLAFEGSEVVRMLAEGEAREGLDAFINKRPPQFA
jgi:enoyl-CoA hydratase